MLERLFYLGRVATLTRTRLLPHTFRDLAPLPAVLRLYTTERFVSHQLPND